MQNKTKRVNSIISLLACTFFVLTCSSEQPQKLKNDTFVKIMSEVMTIESLNVTDSIKVAMIYKALKDENISLEKLEENIKSSETDPEYWYNIYSGIKEQLKEKSKTENEK